MNPEEKLKDAYQKYDLSRQVVTDLRRELERAENERNANLSKYNLILRKITFGNSRSKKVFLINDSV